MKLVLKSYSQDVDILDSSKAKFMLAFEDEDTGHEIRLSVQAETVEDLVSKITLLGTTSTSANPQVTEEFLNEQKAWLEKEGFAPPDADEFGGDIPESEEDVPSL
jgi:hypothetical protein